MKTTTARATRAAFIRWLAAKPDDAFVGRRMECATCPLAEFLSSLEPGCMPHVDGHCWTRWEGDRFHPWRPMPEWARDVIGVADNLVAFNIRANTLREALAQQLGWRFAGQRL